MIVNINIAQFISQTWFKIVTYCSTNYPMLEEVLSSVSMSQEKYCFLQVRGQDVLCFLNLLSTCEQTSSNVLMQHRLSNQQKSDTCVLQI